MVSRRKTKDGVSKDMDSNLKQEFLEGKDFVRLVNNFYTQSNYPADYNRIMTDSNLFNYIAHQRASVDDRKKVAMVFICLNPLYWEFAYNMVDSARKLLLPGHNVDFHFWTDIPEKPEEVAQKMIHAFTERGVDLNEPTTKANFEKMMNGVIDLRNQKDIFLYPTEPIEWPFPTLLRYNLFLQQEEVLKNYDYIFYCDVDMRFVNVVGDEVLGSGLTAAQHPMYAIRKEYNPPYEPNQDSEAFIPRPGKVIADTNGKARFMPLYYAGGFQGGKSDKWISAMKEMRTMIDKDLSKNYIPIWNDESIWNKYLFKNPPEIVLTPSYIYPDSLIREYYEPLWGCSYVPKLVTLTKWFSVSREGGQHVAKMMDETKNLRQ